jgi:hypothetical protein
VCSLWLLCLLPSADLAACPSLNASQSWTDPSFCSAFLSLSVVYLLYYFEYRVVGLDVCVVHLQSFFTRLVYVIFLHCIQMSSFLLRFQNCRGVGYTSTCMSRFNMWFEYPELTLLLLIACICSLYLVLNVRPVCPMYFNGQSMLLI